MEVGSLHWLLLVPLLVVLNYSVTDLGLRRPLRMLLAVLLIGALLNLSIAFTSNSQDLWVLIDRSASAQQTVSKNVREWMNILQSTKPSGDRIRYIEFADSALASETGLEAQTNGSNQASRVALAIRTALSQRDKTRSGRLLLLSDGYSTESLNGLNELLANENVALDYRLAQVDESRDTKLVDFKVPSQVIPGENFLIEALVQGEPGSEVSIDIFRDNQKLRTVKRKLKQRVSVVRLSDQLARGAGVTKYKAVVSGKRDTLAGNNWAQSWVAVQGPKKVLIVSSFDTDPLYEILKARDVPAELVNNPAILGVQHLGSTSAVILNNVSAGQLPEEFIKALDFYVRTQGGGLLMTGGKRSFGMGGYYQSPVDELLPVSMELREDVWRQAATISLVLDRSGSMGASVGGHLGNMTKMDLANEGAARTISLLTEKDYVSLYAVDTKPHEVIGITLVGESKNALMSKARSINSTGGGIYVYSGVKQAWKELKKKGNNTKHIIVFADAADAEEPGEYKKLTKEIVAAGASLSVIALGSRSDPDAEFLIDLAKRGEGRVFFASNPVDLPSVFAQETVAIVRSSFITDPFKVIAGTGWSAISEFRPNWFSQVEGFNQNYIRPKASIVLAAQDEHKSPLVAVWQKGIGRSAAVSMPVAGRFAKRFSSWSEYGDFLHTMVEWLRGAELPGGITIRSEVVGTELFVYDESWEKVLSVHSPKLVIFADEENGEQSVAWERLRPGHFRTRVNLPFSRALRGVVQIDRQGIPFGPISVGKSPEWDFNAQRIVEIKSLSKSSGGQEVVELAQVWNAPRAVQRLFLTPYLICAFLLIFLIEALLSRLGKRISFGDWELSRVIPEFGFSRSSKPKSKGDRDRKSKTRTVKNVTAKNATENNNTKHKDDSSDKSDEAAKDRKSRFERAKRRGV